MDQNNLKKKSKKELIQEELPIFITELPYAPPEAGRPQKPSVCKMKLLFSGRSPFTGRRDHRWDPIFFGPYKNHHPPLHVLKFQGPPHVPKSYVPKQYIDDLLYPKTECKKKIESKKKAKKHIPLKPKQFFDPYSHKCPGKRTAFVPQVKPPVIDLGKTTSVIEGEASLEIPLYRLKGVCSGKFDAKLELVNYSDIKEKQRIFLPYKERIAHIHYPKQFAAVSVIGPTIPASFVITKIPSKRRETSVTNLLSKAEAKKVTKSENGRDSSAGKPEESGDNNDQNDTVVTVAEVGFTSQHGLKENEEEVREEKEELKEENEELKEEVADINEEETVEEPKEEKMEDEETDDKTEENEGQEKENEEEQPQY